MLKAKNYDRFLEMTRIFQKAIKKVQKAHKEKGLPSVYSKNGKIVWELPDGTYVTQDPFENTGALNKER
jgi:hypothetical protein